MKGQSRIFIGTSGWQYDHWSGAFYPEDLPKNDFLKYYLNHFKSVEINNSFYNLPSKKTLENWKKKAPKGFIFSVKASRYITHMKKLKDPKKSLNRFIKRVDTMGKKLGPILFQLPPRWKCNIDRLKNFLDELPSDYRYTFEFRDKSWLNDEVYKLLNDHNIALCIYDLDGYESPLEITADFVYIRLHGPGKPYRGKYYHPTLRKWKKRIRNWAGDQKRSVYIYFDNDDSGYAAQNASQLNEIIFRNL